jgi:tripartite-type tricarboxylate transporter receptor subunit TctC
MNRRERRFDVMAAIAVAGLLCAPPAQAQRSAVAAKDYPNKPVRLVVPYAAGGGLDVVGRILAQKMAPALGQQVVLDNRGGAGGVPGSDHVAKSAPDGYTLLHSTSSHLTLPFFLKSLPYDTVRDFMPVTIVVRNVGHLLVVNNSVPARSVKELIALAKANPGKLNYGSAGNGNVLHLAAELFNVLANTKMTHIPYKGAANAMTDLVGGQIDVCFPTAPTAWSLVQSGRVRALGITAAKRWARLPEVPTLDEAGLKGHHYSAWYALWFPAGTPQEYVERIYREVAAALTDADVRRNYDEQGLVPVGNRPEEFAKTIQDELEFNRKLTARMGVVPE